MSIQQLRYLIALDDFRHFGLAAKSCYVAQPTLTTQFRKLEEELGVQLFDRKSTPPQPTVIGEKVITRARLILDDLDGLHAMLREETESVAGTYTLGIIPTLAPYLLPLFIKPFTSKHPDVHLVVREMQSEQIIDGLNRRQIDIGLLVTPLEEESLREVILFYEPFLIYAEQEEKILRHDPLLPEHLAEKDLWILQQGHCFRNQVLNICQATSGERAERSFTFQAGSIETLKNMVRGNGGFTVIPEMSVDPDQDAGHLKRFAAPEPAREVSLVVSKAFTREKLLAELRREILAVVPENFKKNERYFGVNWR